MNEYNGSIYEEILPENDVILYLDEIWNKPKIPDIELYTIPLENKNDIAANIELVITSMKNDQWPYLIIGKYTIKPSPFKNLQLAEYHFVLSKGKTERVYYMNYLLKGFTVIDQLWKLREGILSLSEVFSIFDIDPDDYRANPHKYFEGDTIENYHWSLHTFYDNEEKNIIGHTNLELKKTDSYIKKMLQWKGETGELKVYEYKESIEIRNKNDWMRSKQYISDTVGCTLNGYEDKCRFLELYFDNEYFENACIDEGLWINFLLENAITWSKHIKGDPSFSDVSERWILYGYLYFEETTDEICWVTAKDAIDTMLDDGIDYPTLYDEYGLTKKEVKELTIKFLKRAESSIKKFLKELNINFDMEEPLI